LLWAYLSIVFLEISFAVMWERWEGTIEYTFMAPMRRLTHLVGICAFALDGMRAALISGRGPAALAADLLPLFLMGAALMPLSLGAFGWAERRAKRLGLLKRSG
jgi:hypothetical protein